MKKIGIIGLGFVGNAIKSSIKDDVWVIIDESKGYNSTYKELADMTDSVFVCVPTAQLSDGRCNTSILEQIIDNLKEVNYQGVIISKCTATPSVYKELNSKCPNLVHAPEFLTAANANEDYVNGKFAVIGGNNSEYIKQAETVIRLTQPNLTKVAHCNIDEASLVKYTINSFLATKVLFMNEIHELTKLSGMDYDKIAEIVKLDTRIGTSHMQVPGPDGKFGFGGACFPKDTSALLKYAQDMGMTPKVLTAAITKNHELRR
jgi:UDPglucose 6-dehydrogenase